MYELSSQTEISDNYSWISSLQNGEKITSCFLLSKVPGLWNSAVVDQLRRGDSKLAGRGEGRAKRGAVTGTEAQATSTRKEPLTVSHVAERSSIKRTVMSMSCPPISMMWMTCCLVD